MAERRNNRTERRCPTCQGAGEIEVNHSGFYATGRQDPQCDEPRPCPQLGCVGGWIRWAPVDRLLILKHWRQQIPTCGAAMRTHYLAERKRVYAPVQLPADRTPVPASPFAQLGELLAEQSVILTRHREVLDQAFGRIFGKAAA